MNDFGISDKLLNKMQESIKGNKNVRNAVIFGSRAKGNYKKYSDIDIALFGDIDEFIAEKIRDELDELDSPYEFDVLAYDCITNESLQQHIDRCGKFLL